MLPGCGDTLAAALRALLPAGIGVGHCKIAANPTGHSAQGRDAEAQIVARAIPARRAEFLAGRSAARDAGAALGLVPDQIGQNADRSPRWPPSMMGSITHHAGHALAVVARAGAFGGLGIDLAEDADLPADVAAEVVFGAEAALPPALVFSAKEAVYKAVFPLTRAVWGFEAVRLSQVGDRITATLRRPAGPYGTGTRVDVRTLRQGGLILTCVVLDPVSGA